MKLIVPKTVSSLSFDGKDVPITKGMIDVEGEAFTVFRTMHGFKTEDEAAEAAAAAKAAATAK